MNFNKTWMAKKPSDSIKVGIEYNVIHQSRSSALNTLSLLNIFTFAVHPSTPMSYTNWMCKYNAQDEDIILSIVQECALNGSLYDLLVLEIRVNSKFVHFCAFHHLKWINFVEPCNIAITYVTSTNVNQWVGGSMLLAWVYQTIYLASWKCQGTLTNLNKCLLYRLYLT